MALINSTKLANKAPPHGCVEDSALVEVTDVRHAPDTLLVRACVMRRAKKEYTTLKPVPSKWLGLVPQIM
jgi:hypothetical protein